MAGALERREGCHDTWAQDARKSNWKRTYGGQARQKLIRLSGGARDFVGTALLAAPLLCCVPAGCGAVGCGAVCVDSVDGSRQREDIAGTGDTQDAIGADEQRKDSGCAQWRGYHGRPQTCFFLPAGPLAADYLARARVAGVLGRRAASSTLAHAGSTLAQHCLAAGCTWDTRPRDTQRPPESTVWHRTLRPDPPSLLLSSTPQGSSRRLQLRYHRGLARPTGLVSTLVVRDARKLLHAKLLLNPLGGPAINKLPRRGPGMFFWARCGSSTPRGARHRLGPSLLGASDKQSMRCMCVCSVFLHFLPIPLSWTCQDKTSRCSCRGNLHHAPEPSPHASPRASSTHIHTTRQPNTGSSLLSRAAACSSQDTLLLFCTRDTH